MRRPQKDIQLTTYDDLLGISEPDDAGMDKVIEVPLTELFPFKNHPFHVLDDEKMEETVERYPELWCTLSGTGKTKSRGRL